MTTSASVLRDAFAHHLWATEALIGALEQVEPSVLDHTVAGTYGTIAATLTHLIDADERYLDRLASPTLPPAGVRAPQPLAILADRMHVHRDRWGAMLDRLDAGDLHARIVGKPDFHDLDPAEAMLLVQALQHGNEHRAQVCSALGALGRDVPDLDAWTFFDRARR